MNIINIWNVSSIKYKRQYIIIMKLNINAEDKKKKDRWIFILHINDLL